MNNSRTAVGKRRDKIVQILQETGYIKVNQLARQLNCSPLTIRRDLAILEEEEKIDRFHGGVSLPKSGAGALGSELALYKHAIAQRAAALVDDGDTIFINTSSTALAMLPYITAEHVTVITNNIAALSTDRRSDMIVVFTGGELQFPKNGMVGDFAINNLQKVTASKCFLGCNGITTEEGVTTAVLQEAMINGIMLTRVTGPRYILADKTKVGRRLSFIYGPLDEVSCLITDTEAPTAEVDRLKRFIKVIQVEPKSSK